MDRDTELALVRRLREGDEAAFDRIHHEYHGRLFNFLARLAQNRAVAEDLVEDTWLRLVGHAASLQPDTRLAAWLFTVARNLYASYCRARLVEQSHAARLIGMWPAGGGQPSPFETLAACEAERRIDAALATLPVRCREALLLVASENMSPSEAAAVCGISAEAMRQRLSRSRALLQQRLDAAERPPLPILEELET